MATVELKLSREFTVNYTGGKGTLTLTPGLNPDIPDEEWAIVRNHAVVQMYMQDGALAEVAYDPGNQGEAGGVEVELVIPEPEVLEVEVEEVEPDEEDEED
jgi:hypothetical protein